MRKQINRRLSMQVGLLLSLVSIAALGGYQLRADDESPRATWGSPKDSNSKIEVLFSPQGGCADAIVRAIEGAEKRIGVQAYFFTSGEIADALAAAAKRGVQVMVILDSSQRKIEYSPWRDLKKAGVRVLFDKEHKTANNKIILIDDDTVITGSYNYTKAAEKDNAENLLIIRGDAEVFDQFRRNFKKHMDHSR